MSLPYSPEGRTAPLSHRLRKIWVPALYQDGRKSRGYFEGWYFKFVDAATNHPIAVIPGVALDPTDATSHSFVQLIRSGGRTSYWEYAADEFCFATDRFEIEVGNNSFSSAGLSLDLDGDAGHVNGEVTFTEWSPWPVRAFSPGIMGWYRFVPFMETYHGVLSMDHGVSGSLSVDGAVLDYEGGRGYVEKDWGRSFPSAWVWAQSNHFETLGTSISVSVARIPWMGSSFVGYIVGLLHEGTLHRFTTYNGARVRKFSLHDGRSAMTLTRGDLTLDLIIEGTQPGKLRSPVLGEMDGVTWESLDATVSTTLRRGGNVLFQGIGSHAGAEFMDTDGELEAGLS
ncbi:MAG: tocopherol cyclase family protein [Actinomycetota bacterium]|nr:tocopherol cyclase family protein [Actinomycetota bacterium]